MVRIQAPKPRAGMLESADKTDLKSVGCKIIRVGSSPTPGTTKSCKSMNDLLDKHLKYWIDGATDALDTAEKLFADKKYHHSLFFLHLAIEKLLKALHQKRKNEPAPPLHNLSRLSELSNIDIDPETGEQLKEISSFNVSARYDDYKQRFYKKATCEYATKWLNIGKKLYEKFSCLL